MIIASIQDPKIYDVDRCADPTYRALLIERLRRMAHNHLWVVDEDREGQSRIGRQLLNFAKSNPVLGGRLNALMRPERVVKIPLNQDRFDGLDEGLLDHESSVAAMVLSQEADPDVLLADEETVEAMRMHHLDTSRTFTLQGYGQSTFMDIEDLAMGGVPVGEFTKADFTQRVLVPLLKYSKQVQVIDKQVIRAAINPDSSGACRSPGRNWSSFKTTIQAMFDAWTSNPIGGRFELVTNHVSSATRQGVTIAGDVQAAELGQLLALDKNLCHIHLKPLDTNTGLRELTHDRYIVSDRGFVLGVSRGFDLIGEGDKCKPADIYLRSSRDAALVITKILRSGSDQGFYGECG